MLAYYNENDPKAAAWLRELIRVGLVMEGIVDTRSICEVRPHDLVGFSRCHFFAGIGGWDYALQLAGWPDSQQVWTGSCPCQPFSSAGKQKGVNDERHLWPVFFNIIRECRPDVVFGEQVASAVGHGWLDGICADLEAQDYACGAVVLGAHSVGAPHIRQRLYWVANNNNKRSQGRNGAELRERRSECATGESCPYGGMGNSEIGGRGECGDAAQSANRGHPISTGLQQGNETAKRIGFWDSFVTTSCRDGKRRKVPIEPAFFPLADGLPARVVRLRGYGNAIVPQVAAAFIEAYKQAGIGLA